MLDAVKELVNRNYSFNSEEDVGVGNAALMTAAGERGHSGLVKRLIQSGVNVNSQDSYGRTALFNAVRCGSRSTIKVLLFHGIDETLSDEDGMTALETAIEEGNRDIINMLFRPSIYKLFVPPYRETPLEWAHAHNHQAAVQIFLKMQKRGLQRKSQSGSKSDEDDMEDNYVEATGNTISGQGWHALINPLLEQSFDINCVMTLTQDKFPIHYLAFAQDGKDLVASNVSDIMTWSTENWRARHQVPGPKAAVV
jgi:ankyrin repeat protein